MRLGFFIFFKADDVFYRIDSKTRPVIVVSSLLFGRIVVF